MPFCAQTVYLQCQEQPGPQGCWHLPVGLAGCQSPRCSAAPHTSRLRSAEPLSPLGPSIRPLAPSSSAFSWRAGPRGHPASPRDTTPTPEPRRGTSRTLRARSCRRFAGRPWAGVPRPHAEAQDPNLPGGLATGCSLASPRISGAPQSGEKLGNAGLPFPGAQEGGSPEGRSAALPARHRVPRHLPRRGWGGGPRGCPSLLPTPAPAPRQARGQGCRLREALRGGAPERRRGSQPALDLAPGRRGGGTFCAAARPSSARRAGRGAGGAGAAAAWERGAGWGGHGACAARREGGPAPAPRLARPTGVLAWLPANPGALPLSVWAASRASGLGGQCTALPQGDRGGAGLPAHLPWVRPWALRPVHPFIAHPPGTRRIPAGQPAPSGPAEPHRLSPALRPPPGRDQPM